MGKVKGGLAVNFVQGCDVAVQVVKEILVQIGEWKAPLSFIIVLMEEFEVILGLKWEDKYLTAYFGRGVDQLLVDHEQENVMVHCTRPTTTKEKNKVGTIHVKVCSTRMAQKTIQVGEQLLKYSSNTQQLVRRVDPSIKSFFVILE